MDSFGSHYQPREETDCFVFADTAPLPSPYPALWYLQQLVPLFKVLDIS